MSETSERKNLKKKLYRVKKETTPVSLYIRSDNGKHVCLLDDQYNNLEEENRGGFVKETVDVLQGSWQLIKYLEKISAEYNGMGIKLSSNDELIENSVRYLVKGVSFLDLEMEIDVNGHERVSDDVWTELTNEESIDPHVFYGLYRSLLTLNTI